MVSTTVSVVVSITLTVPDVKFATYAVVPSGVMASSVGRVPTVMVSTTVSVAVSIAVTVPARLLATYAVGAARERSCWQERSEIWPDQSEKNHAGCGQQHPPRAFAQYTIGRHELLRARASGGMTAEASSKRQEHPVDRLARIALAVKRTSQNEHGKSWRCTKRAFGVGATT